MDQVLRLNILNAFVCRSINNNNVSELKNLLLKNKPKKMLRNVSKMNLYKRRSVVHGCHKQKAKNALKEDLRKTLYIAKN